MKESHGLSGSSGLAPLSMVRYNAPGRPEAERSMRVYRTARLFRRLLSICDLFRTVCHLLRAICHLFGWLHGGWDPARLVGPLLVLAQVGLVPVFCSCSSEASNKKRVLPSVEIATVRSRTLSRNIEKGATVSYFEKAAISSPMKGTLQAINVHEGTAVKKQEALAQLETLKLELSLKKARSRQASARARWMLARSQLKNSRHSAERKLGSLKQNRAEIVQARTGFINARETLKNKKKIFRLGGISRSEMKKVYASYISSLSRYYRASRSLENNRIGFRKQDLEKMGEDVPGSARGQKESLIELNTRSAKRKVESAYSAYQSAKVQTRAAQRLLTEATIRSPINGVVATRKKEPGEEVQPGKPFLTVVSRNKLLIRANVAETDLPDIELGQPAFVRADVYPDVEFEGTVHRITPVVDPKTRSAQISILVRNDETHTLSPGMFARIRIETKSIENAITVPKRALIRWNDQSKGNRATVFLYRKGHVFERKVRTGEEFGDSVQILSGLSEGHQVVLSDPSLLKDSMMVRIAREEEE